MMYRPAEFFPSNIRTRTYEIKMMYASVHTRKFLLAPFSGNTRCQNSSLFKLRFFKHLL